MHARLRHDALVACALALLMTAAWAWSDWADLSMLRLPDTDDAVRLQQIRDWLGGQSWNDLVQHRLGAAPGLPMHWSRLADLGPAAIIALLTPWSGAARAELAAVLVWPGLLFAVALFLAARITRRTGGGDAAQAAVIVAAIAYPATTVFLPGRIDHHNLQLVLLLAATLAMLRGGARSLALTGLCMGASLIVGLEMLPILVALGGVIVWRWIAAGERRPLAAAGLGVAAAILTGRIAFAPAAFAYPACDGFTASGFTAAMLGAAGLVAIALIGGNGMKRRALVAVAVGIPIAALVVLRAPRCLSPYGAIDPQLARLWLAHVQEAQSVAAAAAVTSMGYIGLALVGWGATMWQVRRHPHAGWPALAILLTVALMIGTVQLRGAYAAALLAAPGLGAWITAARQRGGGWLAASWIASAGMLYPLAAEALAGSATAGRPSHGRGDCGSPAAMAALATLPSGIVMAPIDAGAWALAATRHRVLAAPFHRNAAGDLAQFRFYAASPATAARIAAAWHVDYVVACSGLPGADDPASAAAALNRGQGIAGFVRRANATDGTTIFARQRLSDAAPTP